MTVLDREPAGAPRCSDGNAGMIVPSHFVPLAAPGMVGLGLRMLLRPDGPFAIGPVPTRELLTWTRAFLRSANAAHVRRSEPILRDLNLLSRRLYVELEPELGAYGLMRRGLLMLCKSPKTLAEEAHLAERAKEIGLDAAVLDAKGLAKVDPDVEMEVAGGVHFRDDAHLDPAAFLRNLRSAMNGLGVRILDGAEVTGATVDGDRIRRLQTPQGDVEAETFVLAAGAWSGRLGRDLGLHLPMQAGKGYSFTLEEPARVPRLCSILTEARVAVTPMGERLRFAGTMQIGPPEMGVHPRRSQGIVRAIPSYFPAFRGLTVSPERFWTGLRPCSPDGLPYLGRPRKVSNLVVATGHAMMGMSLGPATGRLVSQIVLGETPEVDLALLHPDRFGTI